MRNSCWSVYGERKSDMLDDVPTSETEAYDLLRTIDLVDDQHNLKEEVGLDIEDGESIENSSMFYDLVIIRLTDEQWTSVTTLVNARTEPPSPQYS